VTGISTAGPGTGGPSGHKKAQKGDARTTGIRIIVGLCLIPVAVFVLLPALSSITGIPIGSATTGTAIYTGLQPASSGSLSPFSAESPEGRNVSIVKGIAADYYRTHTYSLPDMFVCADMAADVWNMVETQGIHAVISLGSIDADIADIRDADHAWVIAEIAPGSWLAMETTGGYLVCGDPRICAVDNERYYHGWHFDNPREMKAAIEKIKHPCADGYVLGSDEECHEACGGSSYCTGNSVCIDGKCMGCETGYILGKDLACHPECPEGSGRYCSVGYCGPDGLCHPA